MRMPRVELGFARGDGRLAEAVRPVTISA